VQSSYLDFGNDSVVCQSCLAWVSRVDAYVGSLAWNTIAADANAAAAESARSAPQHWLFMMYVCRV
jgi:hypothetical protein